MNKQIHDMAQVLKDYTTKKKIAASHAILEDYAEELYNAGYRKQEWISVDEALPEEGGTYLIALKEKYECEKEWRYHVDAASFTFEWDCIFHDWDEGQEIHITHWMPLPKAPKMKGGAE